MFTYLLILKNERSTLIKLPAPINHPSSIAIKLIIAISWAPIFNTIGKASLPPLTAALIILTSVDGAISKSNILLLALLCFVSGYDSFEIARAAGADITVAANRSLGEAPKLI